MVKVTYPIVLDKGVMGEVEVSFYEGVFPNFAGDEDHLEPSIHIFVRDRATREILEDFIWRLKNKDQVMQIIDLLRTALLFKPEQ